MTFDNENETEEINESDCCGNGCTNCILDNKPKTSKKAQLAGKTNILLKYTKFKLLGKLQNSTELEITDILDLHFASVKTALESDLFILDVPPGHHLMMRTHITDQQQQRQQLLRPYSPYWSDPFRLEFKIIVNLQTTDGGGRMTKYIANLCEGDEVEFRGPIGNYSHDSSNEPKSIYIISQGVAIAPTLPIIGEVLDNEDDMSRICHLICCKDLEHLYFRNKLLEFSNYWNYSNCIYVAHEQCNTCNKCSQTVGLCRNDCKQFRSKLRYKENATPHRLDLAALRTRLCGENAATKATAQIVVIIAGSVAFQQKMLQYVQELNLNIAAERIFLL